MSSKSSKKKYDLVLPDHQIEGGVWLAVKDLHVDPQTQRGLNGPRCVRYADNFQPGAIGTLVINQRKDGSYYVCDGQHRKQVLELKGIDKVMCEVHYGLTRPEEGILFILKNKESAQVRPIDMYHVGLAAQIPLYVDTEAVLAEHDLKVGNTSANGIGAINAVLKITGSYDADILERVIVVADGAWGRTEHTWFGDLLAGLGQFVGRHAEQIDDARLIQKLASKGAAWKYKGLINDRAGAVPGGGGRAAAAYSVIKDVYNDRYGPTSPNRVL